MIEENVKKHIETKVQTHKEVDIDWMSAENKALTRTRNIFYHRGSIRREDKGTHFPQEIHRFMKNIPSIKPEESPKIHSEDRENHDKSNENPTFFVMVFLIPILLEELKRSKSRNKARKRRSCYKDDIEVDIFGKFAEVDKVCEDIE